MNEKKDITKKEIRKLRELTHLPLSRCLKAFTKAGGNIEKSLEILRKEGADLGAKRLGRNMKAGRIFSEVTPQKDQAVMLSLGCETDFVAKNEGFLELGKALANKALRHRIQSVEELLAQPYQGSTFQEEIVQLAGRVGENIAVIHYAALSGPTVGVYIHTGNVLGVVLSLNLANLEGVDVQEVAENVAIHIAVDDPLAIDEQNIDPEILAKEEDIILARMAEKQIPIHYLEQTKAKELAKFIKSNTLLSQPFVQDETISVAHYLSRFSDKLAVLDFKRMKLGN